jgi:pimeloyl-ACP methyl ester carboxylesterase
MSGDASLSTSPALTFVLVHGFWHSGESWDQVANALRWSGHKVHTPTIAGFGDQPSPDQPSPDNPTRGEGGEHASSAENRQRWGFAAQADSITQYLVEHDLADVVLVGHSYGGAVIQGVAQAVPERIRRLVFQNALVVRDGHAVVDEVPPTMPSPPEGVEMLPPPEYKVWRESMIGDADDKLARRTYEMLRPCPIKPALEKLNLKGFYDFLGKGKLACSYVNATEDTSMPHGEWAWHPRFSNRLGVYRLVQLPGSHEVMFTRPTLLARKLVDAGRD